MAAASPNTIPECSICCENFKAPKFLPCGHTFCFDCVERYIDDKIATFPCPLCGQDITIPDGGAKMFATNFIAQTTTQPEATQQPSSTTSDTTQHGGTTAKQYCTNHSVKEVEYYCINCKTLVCSKCFIIQHNGHEFIDIESETAKERATELVSSAEKFIKDKIENLEKTHATLLETSENLKCFGEDACSRIFKETERIITDIREKSETVQTEIRHNVDQTEIELTETREKVMEKIKNVELDLEKNLPCLTEDSCVQILASLPKIKELEQLCETMKDDTSEKYRYEAWRENKFSVDTDMLGSVVTKSYYLHKLNHFRFNINDIEDEETYYYSVDEYTSNDVVWSCCVKKDKTGFLSIYNEVVSSDNPKLEYCNINRKVSLLNINDDYKTRAKTSDNKQFDISSPDWGWSQFISWAIFSDKNQGYISSDGQFVVQFDITRVKEIKFKEPS